MLRHLEPNPEELRRFLVKSENLVVAHCRTLLQQGLSFTERRRLIRLLGEAETALQSLDPRLKVDAASRAVDGAGLCA
jgi:hypothetical protein